MTNTVLNESFDSGFGALSNVWNVPAPAGGVVTLTGNSAAMEWALGPDAGHGYGTYTVTAKVEGNQPGPGIILWPGDNQWPGQEIDMMEITPDGSGRQYGTLHWNSNGHDAFGTVIYDGVQGGVFHDYQLVWEPGEITFKVDGQVKGSIDEHVPTDFEHGGMNNTIGLMNTNANTSMTVSHIQFTPLGEAPALSHTPPPAVEVITPADETTGTPMNWNALAAQVMANFEATGRWELPSAEDHHAASALQETAVDWNALAARVTANFEATGFWFI